MTDNIVSLSKYQKDRGINVSADMPNLQWEYGQKTFHAGNECIILSPGKGEDLPVVEVVAHFAWPLATFEDIDSQTRGVVLQFITSAGERRMFLASATAWASTQAASKVAEQAAAQGVQIAHKKANQFAELLHSFAHHYRLDDGTPPKTYRMVRRPGWHNLGNRRAYVNGEFIMPAGERICADRSSSVIANRSGRAGELSGWIRAVADEVTTPGLRTALGVSLAGPLVQLFGMDSFGVHFHAQTSVGKTTASAVAASVWGSESKVKQSFNTTQNGLEAAAEQANGACLVMDELGQFRGGPAQMGNAIYDLMSQQGRLRLTQTGEQRQRREWGFSMISNGEISVMDMVGDTLKGGQMVRLMDVEIEKGELTLDSGHAGRIKMALWGSAVKAGNYGHASDQWVHYIIGRDTRELLKTWQSVRDQLGAEHPEANAEEERMLNAIAIVGAALVESVRAKLTPWPEAESIAATKWLARKVISGRKGDSMDTPERRMLRRWQDLILTEPSKFPDQNEERLPPVVYGYRVLTEIWTTEAMLNRSGLPQMVGVSARRFFGWGIREGYFETSDSAEYAGNVRQRWKKFRNNGD